MMGGDNDDEEDGTGDDDVDTAIAGASSVHTSATGTTAASGSKAPRKYWSAEEDVMIVQCIRVEGMKKWADIAARLPDRHAKQVRERYVNHLDPAIRKDPWTKEEDDILQSAYARLGSQWTEISKLLAGRSDNHIKNRWHATLKRRVAQKQASALSGAGTGDAATAAASSASSSSESAAASAALDVPKQAGSRPASRASKASL